MEQASVSIGVRTVVRWNTLATVLAFGPLSVLAFGPLSDGTR